MSFRSALVVDDSRSARFVLRSLLEREQIQVDTVESAQAALEFLRERRPDIVFMDDFMPGMDGLAAIDHMASIPDMARIPIVMYTGRPDPASLEQAPPRGVVGVLSKPFTPEDVRKVLAKVGQVSAASGEVVIPEKPAVARLVRCVDTEARPLGPTAVVQLRTEDASGEPEFIEAECIELTGIDEPAAEAHVVSPPAADPQPAVVSASAEPVVDVAALRAELLDVVKNETRLAIEQLAGELSEQQEARWLESQAALLSAAPAATGLVNAGAAEVDQLRTQLATGMKQEARLAVEQLVGETLENQIAAQMQLREGVWRRILDGLRLENERFQIQILEQRIPRLLELMEQRLENRVEMFRKTVAERLEDRKLLPIQRSMVEHVARVAAVEAVQRPARQSAQRVAAEFIRGDLNAMNQNYDRLRQRFNLLVGLGLVLLVAVGATAYLVGSQV